MGNMIYLHATPDGPIHLIEGDKMPVRLDHPCEAGIPGPGCPMCIGHESDIQAAKESSIPVQNQERAKELIGEQIAALNSVSIGPTFIQPGAIYGPFTVEYRIENRCCANPNLHIGACERDCDAYESFTKTKGPAKVAILLPGKEAQEDEDALWMEAMVDSHAIESIGVSKVIRQLKLKFTITRKQ